MVLCFICFDEIILKWKFLSFEGNAIGSDGAECLAEVLKSNMILTELYLGSECFFCMLFQYLFISIFFIVNSIVAFFILHLSLWYFNETY